MLHVLNGCCYEEHLLVAPHSPCIFFKKKEALFILKEETKKSFQFPEMKD
jgi:hypothetical protein